MSEYQPSKLQITPRKRWRLTVRFSPRMILQLLEIRKKTGRSISALVRYALSEWLKKETTKNVRQDKGIPCNMATKIVRQFLFNLLINNDICPTFLVGPYTDPEVQCQTKLSKSFYIDVETLERLREVADKFGLSVNRVILFFLNFCLALLQEIPTLPPLPPLSPEITIDYHSIKEEWKKQDINWKLQWIDYAKKSRTLNELYQVIGLEEKDPVILHLLRALLFEEDE
ncbi:MAG: hypothetical protein QXS27_06580 [Candidatus Jordarchaeaceae archaeon]